MKSATLIFSAILTLTGALMNSNAISQPYEYDTSRKSDGKFLNQHITYSTSMGNIWDITKAYATTKRIAATPTHIPMRKITADILNETQDALFRLGHSSQLLRIDGHYVLTDPVFSERASMVQWAGPKRFHPMPINVDDLPKIAVVVLSHDHYDHLDRSTLEALAEKTQHFVVPLGLSKHLDDIIDNTKIIELDWWQSVTLEGIEFVATPAQHFSGRGLFDRDETLWASWVINSSQRKVFFSGDSGYFPGFKQIGERYGPFDVTMIETGAYNDLWSDIHMNPEQSVQAHVDLKGQFMLPIHNSTFDLALHDWFEPLERALSASIKHNTQMLSPIFGQSVNFDDLTTNNPRQYQRSWWLKNQ